MQGERKTTRRQIAVHLRGSPAAVSALANEFEIHSSEVLSHVEHLSKSLDSTDESLLVAPPECRECGFSDFDDLINRPSRCPECKSESIEEPAFTIE